MAISGTARRRLGILVVCGAILVAVWPQGLLRAEISAIRVYQVVGSPVTSLVSRCRFQPTCSHYALLVLEQQGLWRGNLRVAQRLLMCSPIGFVLDRLS